MLKMGKFKTYLAGAFCPYNKFKDWRDFVSKRLDNPKIELVDPRYSSNQSCPATFTMDDMVKGVLGSPIIFHYKTRGYEDDGASWEHGGAFAYNIFQQQGLIKGKSKLIIYVDDTAVPFPLHSASASLTFSDLEVGIEFLNGLDSIKKEDYMKHWMDLLDRERAGE